MEGRRCLLLPAAERASERARVISPRGEHLTAGPFLPERSPTPLCLQGMKRTLSKAIMTLCLPCGSLQSSFTPLFHLICEAGRVGISVPTRQVTEPRGHSEGQQQTKYPWYPDPAARALPAVLRCQSLCGLPQNETRRPLPHCLPNTSSANMPYCRVEALTLGAPWALLACTPRSHPCRGCHLI